MLGKTPNKFYDPFLKAGLGYKNSERLKQAIEAQPKIYDGERLQSTKLTIDSPDSEGTLEDTEESRLKMRHKMIPLDYTKNKKPQLAARGNNQGKKKPLEAELSPISIRVAKEQEATSWS
ncbi:hypothetical protein Tco_1047849 [Tanacetum coccineum]